MTWVVKKGLKIRCVSCNTNTTAQMHVLPPAMISHIAFEPWRITPHVAPLVEVHPFSSLVHDNISLITRQITIKNAIDIHCTHGARTL